MKVYITKEEWFPVYNLDFNPTVYDKEGFEMSQEEIELYKEWEKLTNEVQLFLKKKYRGEE